MCSKRSSQGDGQVRTYLYYNPMCPRKSKTKARTAASLIVRMFDPVQTSNADLVPLNLQPSTRKKRISENLEDYTDCSESEAGHVMSPLCHPSRNQTPNTVSRNELSSPKRKKIVEAKPTSRREGLWPRRSLVVTRKRLSQESSDEQGISEEKIDQDETKNENESDNNDGQKEVESDGEVEAGVDEDGDNEDKGEKVKEGRSRYNLRNRAEVCRLPMEKDEQRPRSPQRVLHQGIGTNVGRDVRKRVRKQHNRRPKRDEESDDSALVVHTSASSSKLGGPDIQPLQLDESVSFDDIGGLSEYIDGLKEMVLFPLLYPDFFASYHITPPRGVLLCGPPGTGKTLIARALACTASKAGQKVSFYMRKGADVLSKWVGQAERQLKLLFEEAQRNQPSIIFFDEIDGLAPVRSSNQEQIHNSIVSTLLALMDGLDSRGQVVLIGATNRVDSIDGALRRPGRFDREFNFPLPGCEARAEILDIHTRKWKRPPSRELKSELADSCVGYCGADLKYLCTEAAIHAFRGKYPEVYTSDDKFLIDVNSVKVEKHHFIGAMSKITPASQRGAIVHSRPLSLAVAPCLQRHLQKAMNYIYDIFPPLAMSSDQSTKLCMHFHGSAFPLVYRPRLLLCGSEGSGVDHLAPAILHELEKFPIHSLGLAALLSDPSAKTSEEALVHIFVEARRTTPSILYIPQFNRWWENAHEQLRAVLLTLLEELPSDLPVLLLGTSSVPHAEVEGNSTLVFPLHSIYQVEKPSAKCRCLFLDRLIETALSVLLDDKTKHTQELVPLPQLHKVAATRPKASALKAKVEAEQHALRRLRMCLRDVCNRILYNNRFGAFHYPVTDEDDPNYGVLIHNQMDMATLLLRVNSGQYITCSAFLQDVDLIVTTAKDYNGDDYSGARIVSKAFELRDAVQGMLTQIDPALITYCDKIAAQGGPTHLPDDLGGSIFPTTPVVQLGSTVTRASARLHNNVQQTVNLDERDEARERPNKNFDAPHAGTKMRKSSSVGGNQHEASGTVCGCITEAIGSQDVTISYDEIVREAGSIKQLFMVRTENYGIPQLERLYTRIMKGIFETKYSHNDTKPSILSFLWKFAEHEANF